MCIGEAPNASALTAITKDPWPAALHAPGFVRQTHCRFSRPVSILSRAVQTMG
jgi:hypothetical protein